MVAFYKITWYVVIDIKHNRKGGILLSIFCPPAPKEAGNIPQKEGTYLPIIK
jgi:hypothetical protein